MSAVAELHAHNKAVGEAADEELMLHVRSGNVDMLALLYDRYELPLFNFYCRLTGDRSASEDLVHDVFFRILKYRRTFRPGTSFRTWMYQIARNARVDYVRKRRNEVRWEDDLEPPAGGYSVASVAERDQEVELLRRALLKLPEDRREILLLSRFQDLKYEQIGELLGCEAGTVKVRVFRALQELRRVFLQLSRRSAV